MASRTPAVSVGPRGRALRSREPSGARSRRPPWRPRSGAGRQTTPPDALAPCAWNTCLARSRPMVLTSSTDASPVVVLKTPPPWHVDAVGGRPPHHWRTMTFLAALRHDRVEAPWLLDGPINGETFRLYVDKVLAPTLRQGDIVVMDNLGSHKSKAVRRAIRAAGARLLFLPKYSPDLNPIEQLFSKLKHWLRRAAGRTADAVCNALGPILETVTPDECSRYFAHAGYGQT